jgi:hypothetical protein
MIRKPYFPEIHDPILINLNRRRKRSDQEIADEMGFNRNTVWTHRVRLGLTGHTSPRSPDRGPIERAVPAPKERPNPIAVAQHTLGDRLVERPAGFFLDRMPVSMDTMMREANRVRAKLGLEQVGVLKWRV